MFFASFIRLFSEKAPYQASAHRQGGETSGYTPNPTVFHINLEDFVNSTFSKTPTKQSQNCVYHPNDESATLQNKIQ